MCPSLQDLRSLGRIGRLDRAGPSGSAHDIERDLLKGDLSMGADRPLRNGPDYVRHAAPSAERRAPSAERRAPSAERRAPSAERRAPSAERRAPSAERRAPSAERRAPSAERRAPSAERRAPSAERRAPSAERRAHDCASGEGAMPPGPPAAPPGRRFLSLYLYLCLPSYRELSRRAVGGSKWKLGRQLNHWGVRHPCPAVIHRGERRLNGRTGMAGCGVRRDAVASAERPPP